MSETYPDAIDARSFKFKITHGVGGELFLSVERPDGTERLRISTSQAWSLLATGAASIDSLLVVRDRAAKSMLAGDVSF